MVKHHIQQVDSFAHCIKYLEIHVFMSQLTKPSVHVSALNGSKKANVHDNPYQLSNMPTSRYTPAEIPIHVYLRSCQLPWST